MIDEMGNEGIILACNPQGAHGLVRGNLRGMRIFSTIKKAFRAIIVIML